MIRYTISTNARLAGVQLAKAGHWGGLKFHTDAEAEAFAVANAGARPYTIDRADHRPRLIRKPRSC